MHRQAAPSSTSTSTSPTVQALVNELKMKKTNGDRAWALFEELDLQGQSYLVPLATLHYLLSAIRPRTTRGRDRTVKKATQFAQEFEAKADLVRLAIRQAGGTYSSGDLKALLATYQAIGYGPGAIKAWDEALKCGIVPGTEARKMAFNALADWVELNCQADMEASSSAAGERAKRTRPGRAAAQSVVSRMFGMLFRDTTFVPAYATPTANSALSCFFSVLARAGDLSIVGATLKNLYGINVDLPGGLIDATVADRAKLRAIGERDVHWMLKSLGATGDLNRLIGLFEYFDRPSQVDQLFVNDAPPPDAYFTSQGYDSQPAPAATLESQSHLVGTQAVVAVVRATAEAGNLSLVRHYFDLLFVRYAQSTHARLREIEQAIGMPEVFPSDTLDSATELVDEKADPLFAYRPTGTTIASFAVSHLALSPSEPSKPWTMPNTLISHVSHVAYAKADAGTLKWALSRARRIVRLREEEVGRMEAVVKRIQASVQTLRTSAGVQTEGAHEDGLDHIPADLLDPILSYLRDSYGAALESLQKTRAIFYEVRSLSRVITTEDRLGTHQYELALRERRLADARLNKQQYFAILRQKDKKATNVLAYKVWHAQNKIAKLRYVDGVGRGNRLFDYWTAKLQILGDEVYRKQEQEQWAQQAGSRGSQAQRTAADFTAGIRAAVAMEQQVKEAKAAALAEARAEALAEARLQEAAR
ncbi:proteophosphoglycan ppg4 [Rhodotorula toruloides]|uniref:Proteophosphoglycan ppg4 n=1 Tax=Rhodotorula toruloides TaxID=5286 RepID=A0A511KK27_RHOTO|nr:proteophosphoglycan ppg4 [Rhodotorula toruloides]